MLPTRCAAWFLLLVSPLPASERMQPSAVCEAKSGPITISASPADLRQIRIAHEQLTNAMSFMWWENVDCSCLEKHFPRGSAVEQRKADALWITGKDSSAHWELEMTAVPDGAILKLTVTNTGTEPWKDICAAISCFSPRYPNGSTNYARPIGQERGRSPFADRDNRDHTYALNKKGELQLLTPMGAAFASPAVEAAVKADANWLSTWWNESYPPAKWYPSTGLLIRYDQTSGWVMALYWDDWVHLKTHDLFDCLHVDPRFGALKPGESKTLHGRLYLYQGSPARVLSHGVQK
jgi:YD repeat-containing protein